MPDEIVDIPVGNVTFASLAAGSIGTSAISGGYTGTLSWVTSTTTNITWAVAAGTVASDAFAAYYEPPTDPEPTPEERAEWERANAEHRRRAAERQAGRDAAAERAAELLLSILDEAQVAQYRADRSFEVVGSLGGRYRIRSRAVGNVDALGADGVWIGALCAHPSAIDGFLPIPDVQLAQMLHIVTDEADWLRTANVHRGRRPPIPA